MLARVVTDLEGGSVELTYTQDPKYIDGLSREEIVTTILGQIPALLYAMTHVTVNEVDLAYYLRDYADIWDPEDKEEEAW